LFSEIGVPLAEEAVQPTIEDSTANLQQQMRAFAGPAHGLAFSHPLIHQMAHRGLGQSARNPQAFSPLQSYFLNPDQFWRK
jgi:hypothetical protein